MARALPTKDSDRPLPVSELTAKQAGLAKSADDSEARARTAKATAFLSYADLPDALGLEIPGLRRGPGRARLLTPLGYSDDDEAASSSGPA